MLSKEIAVAVLYRDADAFAPAGTRLKIARAAYTTLVPGRAPLSTVRAWRSTYPSSPGTHWSDRLLSPIPGSSGLRTVAARDSLVGCAEGLV